jgi:hypothetical protein
MLITLVNTKKDGKQILHKYPYERISLDQEGLEKNSLNDIEKLIDETFDECTPSLIQSASIAKNASSPPPMTRSPIK